MIGCLYNKIIRKLQHLCLQPIPVFVFHKVDDVYNPSYGGIEDWTETKVFKARILRFKETYTFISLQDAYRHLCKDKIRCKKYAVLTSDDGYQSLIGILPWLEEEHIPITLFLCVQYLDGVSHDPWFDECWQCKNKEEIDKLQMGMYLQTRHLSLLRSPNVTVCLHGYGHDEVSNMTYVEFAAYLKKCMAVLQSHPQYAPYYAYAWGHHSPVTDSVLHNVGIVPIYCDGMTNYVFDGAIHRICIDGQ